MNNNQLKQKADELWYLFENNIFDNKGNFSYNTNLVFAFADYIEELTNTDLSEFLQSDDEQDIVKFRKMLQEGINRWLDDFAKTFAIM
ncbi:MAG: hypothetical protein IJZ59_03965 [Alphaproteobacteria bacterium]|nr:hypothetical protein [Alphaproteobacteria bacterium]